MSTTQNKRDFYITYRPCDKSCDKSRDMPLALIDLVMSYVDEYFIEFIMKGRQVLDKKPCSIHNIIHFTCMCDNCWPLFYRYNERDAQLINILYRERAISPILFISCSIAQGSLDVISRVRARDSVPEYINACVRSGSIYNLNWLYENSYAGFGPELIATAIYEHGINSIEYINWAHIRDIYLTIGYVFVIKCYNKLADVKTAIIIMTRLRELGYVMNHQFILSMIAGIEASVPIFRWFLANGLNVSKGDEINLINLASINNDLPLLKYLYALKYHFDGRVFINVIKYTWHTHADVIKTLEWLGDHVHLPDKKLIISYIELISRARDRALIHQWALRTY